MQSANLTYSIGLRTEIQLRLQRRFLDRLAVRIKSIRKYLIERNWEKLKCECDSLRTGAEQFGFQELAQLSAQVAFSIPNGRVSKVTTLPVAKEKTQVLIRAIDDTLMDRLIIRP